MHGNPVHNGGTKSPSYRGYGDPVSDEEVETWRAAADEVMKGFHFWPEESSWSVEGNPNWTLSADGSLASQGILHARPFASSLVPKGRRVRSFY
jgi:hypothetical protein